MCSICPAPRWHRDLPRRLSTGQGSHAVPACRACPPTPCLSTYTYAVRACILGGRQCMHSRSDGSCRRPSPRQTVRVVADHSAAGEYGSHQYAMFPPLQQPATTQMKYPLPYPACSPCPAAPSRVRRLPAIWQQPAELRWTSTSFRASTQPPNPFSRAPSRSVSLHPRPSSPTPRVAGCGAKRPAEARVARTLYLTSQRLLRGTPPRRVRCGVPTLRYGSGESNGEKQPRFAAVYTHTPRSQKIRVPTGSSAWKSALYAGSKQYRYVIVFGRGVPVQHHHQRRRQRQTT